MDLFLHEHLKDKAMNDIVARCLTIEKMKAWEVKKLINDAKNRLIASGDFPKTLSSSPGFVKKCHISHLTTLHGNFAKTTNERHGGQHFRDDIEQRLLNWEDVLKSWPLDTENIQYRKFKPKEDKNGPAVKQTIYDY